MKLVLATDAALLEAPALRADRATAEERKSVADMIADFELRGFGYSFDWVFEMDQLNSEES